MTYLISCSISSRIRQTVGIKFDDLKLPAQTIDHLKSQSTGTLRPQLSNSLKAELDSLRAMQRDLYDECTINFGDSHFVTAAYFEQAQQRIKDIKRCAQEANQRLASLWDSEFDHWCKTVENMLRPLFRDEQEYQLAKEAYLRVFPTRRSYKDPIRVAVVGPLPVSMTPVENADEGDIEKMISAECYINTSEVIEAAREGAADRALQMGAELLDDLDVRNATKIGKAQVGSEAKRGSWQLTADRLRLISDSVPGFEKLSTLANQLLDAGRRIQSADRKVRDDGVRTFQDVGLKIRQELQNIVEQRDHSKGLEALQKSLTLSGQFKDLCEKIKTAEGLDELQELSQMAELEQSIYQQRSKQLTKLIAVRRELIDAGGRDLNHMIEEVQNVEDIDF